MPGTQLSLGGPLNSSLLHSESAWRKAGALRTQTLRNGHLVPRSEPRPAEALAEAKGLTSRGMEEEVTNVSCALVAD